MRHVRKVTRLPAFADDTYEPGPIPISVLLTLIASILAALEPYLEEKFPSDS